MIKNNKPAEISALIKNSVNPVCFIDSRLDADAFCSAIAMKKILKQHFGSELSLFYERKISPRYYESAQGLFNVPEITEETNPEGYDFSSHDLMIFLDTGNINHISKTYKFTPPANLTTLNIDHHSANPRYGGMNYVKAYGATATVLYELVKSWKVKMDQELANIFLMAIVLDTGMFQYNTTTEKDFRYTAELIKHGANHYELMWALTFNDNPNDIALTRLVLNKLVIKPELKVAYSAFTYDEMRHNDISKEDSIIAPADVIKKIKGLDFVFTIIDIPEEQGLFNVSLRAHHEEFDCVKLAKALSPVGGGHRMAAGVNVRAENIEEAIKIVLETAQKTHPKYQGNS